MCVTLTHGGNEDFDTHLLLVFPLVLLGLAYYGVCSTVGECEKLQITFTFLLVACVPALLGRSNKKINFANSNTIFQVMMSFDLFSGKW